MAKKDVNVPDALTTHTISVLTAQLAAKKREAEEIKREIEVLRNKIIKYMDQNQMTVFADDEYKVTLARGERIGFNKDAFKAEHAVMFARYQTKVTPYEILKIKAIE